MSVALPSLDNDNSPDAVGGLELTVTGEDAGNNLFREKVRVRSLKGCDCAYESHLRIQPGSSLMIEIPPGRAGGQTWRAAAIVETVAAMGSRPGLFLVSIVLGRSYDSETIGAAVPDPPHQTANPISEKPEPKGPAVPALPAVAASPGHPEGASGSPEPEQAATTRGIATPVSERQMRELKIAVASQMEEALQESLATKRAQPAPAQGAPAPAGTVIGEARKNEGEPVTGTMRTVIAQMVREAVTSECEWQMRELRGSISQEVKRASQAPMAELTKYAKALPAINEQIIRQTVEEATGQQVVRTTALLQPAVAEMVRESVEAETARQTRELKSVLSRELESAIREPLACMAQYAQSLPAIDEETVRHLVGQVAEAQFQRATTAIEPLIAGVLRNAIAAEYERQTLQLRNEIVTEVRKAIEGPGARQMETMIETALAKKTSQYQQKAPSAPPPADEDNTIQQLMDQLQIMLDSLGGTMRCVLEPNPNGAADDAAAAASPKLSISAAEARDLQ
jgi:hypothetical protein